VLPPSRFDWAACAPHQRLREVSRVVQATRGRAIDPREEFRSAAHLSRAELRDRGSRARFHVTAIPGRSGDHWLPPRDASLRGQFNTVVYQEEDLPRKHRRDVA
jgi:hypothetical protein